MSSAPLHRYLPDCAVPPPPPLLLPPPPPPIHTQGGIFHLVGVVLLIVVLPAVAPSHNSASWVFTSFEPQAGYDAGIMSPL